MLRFVFKIITMDKAKTYYCYAECSDLSLATPQCDRQKYKIMESNLNR